MYTRNSIRYKVGKFFRDLDKRDFVRLMRFLDNVLTAFAALVIMFFFIFIAPHLFH